MVQLCARCRYVSSCREPAADMLSISLYVVQFQSLLQKVNINFDSEALKATLFVCNSEGQDATKCSQIRHAGIGVSQTFHSSLRDPIYAHFMAFSFYCVLHDSLQASQLG